MTDTRPRECPLTCNMDKLTEMALCGRLKCQDRDKCAKAMVSRVLYQEAAFPEGADEREIREFLSPLCHDDANKIERIINKLPV